MVCWMPTHVYTKQFGGIVRTNAMPPAMERAQQQLDKAVDFCYRPQPFINETKSIEFLFELYDRYVGGMFGGGKKGNSKGKKLRRAHN